MNTRVALSMLMAAWAVILPAGPGEGSPLRGQAQPIAGYGHTCALLPNGQVACWGANRHGQLGNGTTTDSAVPVTLPGITAATAVEVGADHTCALLADGTVRCWGGNFYGQLGNERAPMLRSSTPVTVSGITTARAIAAGADHTCALLADGTVRCWGLNTYGQLGKATAPFKHSSTPLMVPGITTARAIASGTYFTCVRLADTTNKCWGGTTTAR